MNYNEALNFGINVLKKNNIKNPNLDTELLLSSAVNSDRESILINLQNNINSNQFKKFNIFLQKRVKKKPISQILGIKEFWREKFHVDENVLTPRPDSELIIEEAIKFLKNKKKNLFWILEQVQVV